MVGLLPGGTTSVCVCRARMPRRTVAPIRFRCRRRVSAVTKCWSRSDVAHDVNLVAGGGTVST